MTGVLIGIVAIFLTVYSWGFVEANVPLFHIEALRNVVYNHRPVSSMVYLCLFVSLFVLYLYVLQKSIKKTLSLRQFSMYLGIFTIILFFSFPAFSNDIFNYIATAKVTFLYRENPYVVMPIEITREPMLSFMHAANKTALYGPVWILLTGIPHVLGGGNLIFAMYAFKVLVLLFYFLMIRLIWRMTGKLTAVVFFAMNPLVIIDTLVSGHNDVVMMFFAVLSFWLLKQKRYVWALLFLGLSVLVKGATIMLLPIFFYVWWRERHSIVDWERIWTWSALSMFLIFLLSPLREEMYSWYFIWPLSFVALRKRSDILTALSLGFTFGLPLRFLPFVLYRDWGGITPIIKKVVTFVPPGIAGLWYASRKNR